MRYLPVLFIGTVLTLMVNIAAMAATTFTVMFDNTGNETGITIPGTMDFSIFGANFSGGTVFSAGDPPLYASGAFAYHPKENGVAMVTFDAPVDSINAFFVHETSNQPSEVRAFDGSDSEIANAQSNLETFRADSDNFITLDPTESIARLEFTGGVVDNLEFTAVPLPASMILLASGILVLLGIQRKTVRN